MSDKAKEIRTNALHLFQKYGYDHVSVNDIAKSANISKNTFYYHYKSKEELLMGLFVPDLTMDQQDIVDLMAMANVNDQILTLYGKFIGYFEGLGKEIVKVALMTNLSSEWSFMKKAHTNEFPPFMKMLVQTIQRAMDTQMIRHDCSAQMLLRLSMTLMLGALQVWACHPDLKQLQESYLQQLKIVFEMK